MSISVSEQIRNDKYFEKMADKIDPMREKDWDYLLPILKQIALDQREACVRDIVDLLEPDHSFEEVEKITEAVRTAEIGCGE